MVETGHFATLWQKMAKKLGLDVDFIPGDWRHGADAAADRGAARRRQGPRHQGGVRRAQRDVHRRRDAASPPCARRSTSAKHPALLLVDTISSLASIDYRHDEWGVDVTVGGSQKGLMLPPGLSFNAISEKALAALEVREAPALVLGLERDDRGQRQRLLSLHARRRTCSTACARRSHMLEEEGLANVFARHDRHAEATRRAVRAWGLEILCANPDEYSSSLTAVMMPPGHDADRLRAVVLEHFDMSLGHGARQAHGQGLPHRPPGRLQRPHADGDPFRASKWGSRSPRSRTAKAARRPPWSTWRTRRARTKPHAAPPDAVRVTHHCRWAGTIRRTIEPHNEETAWKSASTSCSARSLPRRRAALRRRPDAARVAPVSRGQGRRARRHGADDRQGSEGGQRRPRHPGLSRRLALQAQRPVERDGERPARHHALPARLRERQGAGLQRHAHARPHPQPGARQAHQPVASS